MPLPKDPTKRCIAIAKSTKQPCGQAIVPGTTKCRRHGGNGGPPQGNQNATKHGLFSRILTTADEREVYEQVGKTSMPEVARESVQLIMAKVHGAFNDIAPKGVAVKALFDHIDGMVKDEEISEDIAQMFKQRLAGPRIDQLGKVMSQAGKLMEVADAANEAGHLGDAIRSGEQRLEELNKKGFED